jgi:hypothetical protein
MKSSLPRDDPSRVFGGLETVTRGFRGEFHGADIFSIEFLEAGRN